MTTTPQNGAELLARIRPTLGTKTARIVLRPDLIEAWEEANTALIDAQVSTSKRQVGAEKADTADARKLAKKVQALEAEIKENAITFTFRALPKDEWRALTEEYPPRAGNNMDHLMGYDRGAVADAAVRACMVDPVFDDKSWAELVKVCNPGEWNELRETVNLLNGAVTDLPKSSLASQVLARPGTTSRQPKSGA